jgi:ABC-type nitrate/sulfonate/bicarbonate transport system ATPase subunit
VADGIFQVVGETGWQLSHGERSRLFVARAVLQRPEVLILDESFAALDPETLRSTLEQDQSETTQNQAWDRHVLSCITRYLIPNPGIVLGAPHRLTC